MSSGLSKVCVVAKGTCCSVDFLSGGRLLVWVYFYKVLYAHVDIFAASCRIVVLRLLVNQAERVEPDVSFHLIHSFYLFIQDCRKATTLCLSMLQYKERFLKKTQE